MKNIIIRFLAFLFLFWLSSFLWKPILGSVLLRYIGKCKTAYLINETTRVQYHKPTILYSFSEKGNTYTGNSNIIDLSKNGDSLCITYLDFMPSMNRPLSYYDIPINCSCK